MELRLPLEVSPGREATCRAVFGTWGSFPDDARAGHCPFVLTCFTGWSSERCPGIGFLPRGDREIGVLRNVEAPTRPRLECRREPGLILRCDRKVGNPLQTKQGSRPSRPDLNHPAVALGYRIEADGVAVVYLCDHEPFANTLWRADAEPGRIESILHS